jgi:hypothetical protein
MPVPVPSPEALAAMNSSLVQASAVGTTPVVAAAPPLGPSTPVESIVFVRPRANRRRGFTISARGEQLGQFNTRIPAKVREDLEAAAREAGMSMTRFLVEVLRAARITDFEWKK